MPSAARTPSAAGDCGESHPGPSAAAAVPSSAAEKKLLAEKLGGGEARMASSGPSGCGGAGGRSMAEAWPE